MHTAQDVFSISDFTFYQCYMMFPIQAIYKSIRHKLSVSGRHFCGRHAIHQNIMAFTVILNIFNCYEFKIPLSGKFP